MKLGELEGIVARKTAIRRNGRGILLQGSTFRRDATSGKCRRFGRAKDARAVAQALFGIAGAAARRTTNHLDLDSIHWLKNFLNQYEGC